MAQAEPARVSGAREHSGWLSPHELENLAPAAIAIAVAAVLQFALPARFVLLRPQWLLPSFEMALLVTLLIVNARDWDFHARAVGIALVAVISADNNLSAMLLVWHLVSGNAGATATPLLATGGSIYITNMIAYGIWYWQIDRGGPRARAASLHPYPDFLFPQMTQEHLAADDWRPLFLDYFYLSLTNVTAFSPTDTLPLTRRAKTLMATQSLVALSTMSLVLARAVNILK